MSSSQFATKECKQADLRQTPPDFLQRERKDVFMFKFPLLQLWAFGSMWKLWLTVLSSDVAFHVDKSLYKKKNENLHLGLKRPRKKLALAARSKLAIVLILPAFHIFVRYIYIYSSFISIRKKGKRSCRVFSNRKNKSNQIKYVQM